MLSSSRRWFLAYAGSALSGGICYRKLFKRKTKVAKPKEGMPFEEALKHLKHGRRIARHHWFDRDGWKDKYLKLREGTIYEVKEYLQEGVEVLDKAFIYNHDIMAEDWYVVE